MFSEAVESSVGAGPGVCLASSRCVCKELMLPGPWGEGTLSLIGFMGATGCLVGWRRVPHGQPSCISPFTQFQSNAALFEAVELQDLDRVQEMLKHYSPEELDLNTPNSEGLLPLDIAIMTNNAPIARALLQAGAKESPHCELGQGCARHPAGCRGAPQALDAGGEAITGLWEAAGCSRARGEPCTPMDSSTRTRRGGWGLGVGIHCQQRQILP